jgi:hypothetical protein
MTLMMKDFHQMRVDVVLAAEKMVKHLMYDLEPDVNLDQIHDNLANWNVGYSFMTDKHNNLQKEFHALRTAATSAEGPRCLMNRKFQYRVRRCQDCTVFTSLGPDIRVRILRHGARPGEALHHRARPSLSFAPWGKNENEGTSERYLLTSKMSDR